MTTPTAHPTWCDPARCSVTGPRSGSHQSRAAVIRRNNLRSQVFLDRAAIGGHVLVIIERYTAEDATEPDAAIGFWLDEASMLTHAINELVESTSDAAPDRGTRNP